MQFTTAVALFAAGSYASPLFNYLVAKDVVTVTAEDVVYQTVTAGEAPSSTSTTEAAVSSGDAAGWGGWKSYHEHSSSAVASSTSSVAPVVTTSLTPTTSSTSTPAPTTSTTPTTTSTTAASTVSSSAAASSTADSSVPTNDGVSMITTINNWRKAKGVGNLSWSSQLEANSAKTGSDDGGVNQVHELNSGSYAQVITPGFSTNTNDFSLNGMTPFDLSYVAWLCEAPFGPLSEGSPTPCGVVNDVLHMEYDGTGHADILNDNDYTTIGCSFTQNPSAESTSPWQGLWICDLGF